MDIQEVEVLDARDHGIGSFAPRSEVVDLTAERDRLSKEVARLQEALKHILWIKDCGIDGRNEKGEFVNWSAQERDEMYKIASAALSPAEER